MDTERIHQDVTAGRHAEEAAWKLAAIVESSEDAIIGMTLDGVITSWNPGAERLYGYAEEKVRGQNISLLYSAEQAGEIHSILERTRRRERVAAHEARLRRADG